MLFSDLRTKELRMFLSSDTIENIQKPQTTPKKLNKQSRKLMKKFSQISQSNGPGENTVSCDYYDLNDFNKFTVTQDLAALHLNIFSLTSHINELKLPLSSLNLNFDIMTPQACNLIKKETLALVFSCEFFEISKNTFLTEHLRATASQISKLVSGNTKQSKYRF